jgi:hypothetical protein
MKVASFIDGCMGALKRNKSGIGALLGLLVLMAPRAARAQFGFETNADGETITITNYTGPGGDVVVPGDINGLTVANIAGWSFASVSNMTSVTLPDSLTNIGTCAFEECRELTNISLGTGLADIGTDAFLGCGLTSLAIPGNVTSIGQMGFSECPSLTNVTIANGLASIGAQAFLGCITLATVAIPASVTNIGEFAFNSCPELASFAVDGGNSFYSSVDGVLFDKNQTTLVSYPQAKGTNYTIPNGVMRIQEYAFEDFAGLASVSFPDSLTAIGEYAFCGCSALTSITLGDSLTNISDEAFMGCGSLTNAVIGKSFYFIGQWAFCQCSNLASVYFKGNAPTRNDWTVVSGPNTLPFQGDPLAMAYYLPCTTGWGTNFGGVLLAFGDDYDYYGGIPTAPWWQAVFSCTTNNGTLTITGDTGACGTMTVTIPASINGLPVTAIGANVFAACTNLESAYFYGNAPAADPTAFSVSSDATVYYSPAGAGWGSTYAGFPTAPWWGAVFEWWTNSGEIIITDYTGPGGAVTVPGSINGLPVTTISAGVFASNTTVTSVTIGGGVTTIGLEAFCKCTGLTNLTLPASLTNVDEFAFAGCSLTKIFFLGDPFPVSSPRPFNVPDVFAKVDRWLDVMGYENATAYYLPGTAGWSNTFAGLPALLWNPAIQTGDGRFGVSNSQFGFNVTGTANIPVVVEACSNPANPVWTALTNVTPTNGQFYFSEAVQATNAGRFYRIRSP